jgi:hypothetical protein
MDAGKWQERFKHAPVPKSTLADTGNLVMMLLALRWDTLLVFHGSNFICSGYAVDLESHKN